MPLSHEEEQRCGNISINSQLDEFRNEFRSSFPGVDSGGIADVVRSVVNDEAARNLTQRLFLALLSVHAMMELPSRQSSSPSLFNDLSRVIPLVPSGRFNIEATAVLLEKVITRSSDIEIWCAIYDLVTPVTPPHTPGVPVSTSDTPYSFGSGAVFNTDEGRKYMDPIIENEMKDHIYLDVPDFFSKFFDSVNGLQELADAVFARCLRDSSYMESKRWRSYPASCDELSVAEWFIDEVGRIAGYALEEGIDDAATKALKSRRVVSMPTRPIGGSTAPRKLDIGFAALNHSSDDENARGASPRRSMPTCQWHEILVPGELKESMASDRKSATWYDLGRYVREVYASQDTRRFCHGFTLCGGVMRVWKYDRGGIYSAQPFNVNDDGRKLVTVVLGYLLMREEELGYDTTIIRSGTERYILVKGDNLEAKFLIKKTMHKQACIIGRATTCWHAVLEGTGNGALYVIKDSWQYDGNANEGEFLMDITKAGVQNVGPCYYHATVCIGDMDDDLRGCVRKDLDMLSGKKWRPRIRKELTGGKSSRDASSTSIHKRVASATLENDKSQKRSRSNPQGESGRRSGSITVQGCHPQNRIHKRVIMSQCGKQLYMTKNRVGLLRGLIDGITGEILDFELLSSDAIQGHQNLFQMKILHRDISIGNVLITEDETEGFLIDLDHAINIERDSVSGAKGRTGTKVFMSVGLLLQGDSGTESRQPHSFMDDLESMFWLLFWICVRYSGPCGKQIGSTEYEEWNFRSLKKLGNEKAGVIGDEQDFLDRISADFTDYFAPLAKWVNQLRRQVFQGGLRWRMEDITLYDRMRDVLKSAMDDPAVRADWCGEDG